MDYVNFYENLKEAQARLQGTVVTYDGEPYYVLCITDHKKDGIFRMYLDPLSSCEINKIRMPLGNWDPSKFTNQGDAFDDFLDKNPSCKVIRKMMNSPSFNRFRPFDLGMAQAKDGSVWYLERQPTRPSTNQGLSSNAISQRRVTSSDIDKPYREVGIDLLSPQLGDCITGNYRSAEQCIATLTDSASKDVKGMPFHRQFAFIKGPVDSLFLNYKRETVGFLPNSDLSKLVLPGKHRYLKEILEEQNIFSSLEFNN